MPTGKGQRHTISHAEFLFSGTAQYNAANNSKRGVPFSPLLKVSLGTPDVADVDLVLDGASLTAATDGLTTDVVLDVPRNLQIVSTDAGDDDVVTISGLDQYGEAVSEEFTVNGTTPVVGLKAFKTVQSVISATTPTGDFDVGTGSALGLPYRVDAGGLLMAYEDSALDLTTSAVLGTFLPADTTDPATATDGDVRGTYDPNGTLDGSAEFTVLIQIADVTSKTGAYGVAQFSA
jgi:hypothetical protein